MQYLWVLTIGFILICGGCLSGTTSVNYENKDSGKVVIYEREGNNTNLVYNSTNKTWYIKHEEIEE